MRSKLFLVVLTVIAALVATAVPGSAQNFAECPAGQVHNPYYCIPDIPGPGGTARKATKRVTLNVKHKHDRSAPIRYRASGRVVRPSGVSQAAGCRGRVRVAIKEGRKVVAKKSARVRRSCRYSTAIKVKNRKLNRTGKLKVRARFTGNDRLKAKKSKTVRVRYTK